MSPQPSDIPFVATNLDCLSFPSSLVDGIAVVHIGERPYWRLTPVVLAWAIRQLAAAESAGRAIPREALELIDAAGVWVSSRFPAEAIAAAFRGPARLPPIPQIPTLPDNSQRKGANGGKAKANGSGDSRPARAVHAS